MKRTQQRKAPRSTSSKNQDFGDDKDISGYSIPLKDTWFDRLVLSFLQWFEDPKNKMFAFRVMLFVANALLLLGIFIFIFLNFVE